MKKDDVTKMEIARIYLHSAVQVWGAGIVEKTVDLPKLKNVTAELVDHGVLVTVKNKVAEGEVTIKQLLPMPSIANIVFK